MRRRRSAVPPTAPDADLTLCRTCASDCVVPTDWKQQGESSWWIRLRCGACRASREVVVPDAAAQHYDLELDRGMGEIALTLHQLEREKMLAYAETFATALHLDLVDAGDFAR
jgi:hypothetical protein